MLNKIKIRLTIRKVLGLFKFLPNLDKELILSKVLSVNRLYLISNLNQQLSNYELLSYFYYLFQRFVLQKPIAYITKSKFFYGLEFYIDKRVLVPRPETELMVEEILKTINYYAEPITLVDVGTGSGIIPISVYLNTKKYLKVLAIDKYQQALMVFKKNLIKFNLEGKIKFKQTDLLKGCFFDKSAGLLVFSANLPYLNWWQIITELSLWSEPISALVSRKSGLNLYFKFLKQLKDIKNKKIIFLEIDPQQVFKLKKYIQKEFPKAQIDIIKDLAGWERIIKIICF